MGGDADAPRLEAQRGLIMQDWFELWDFNDPESTEAKFRALEGTYRASGEDAYLTLHTQIARTLGLQKRFDEAHAVLDEVGKALPRLDARTRAYYHLERGRTYRSSSRTNEAIQEFDQAWMIAQEAGEDDLAVDAAHMLGIAHSGELSLQWNETAIQLAQSSPMPRAQRWRASLLNNTAWTYHDLGQFERALELFREAEKLREEQGDAAQHRAATWMVGRCLRSMNRLDEALQLQTQLIARCEADDAPDGFVFEELAECLTAMDDPIAARPHFSRAWELLKDDPWIEADRLQRLQRLGVGNSSD